MCCSRTELASARLLLEKTVKERDRPLLLNAYSEQTRGNSAPLAARAAIKVLLSDKLLADAYRNCLNRHKYGGGRDPNAYQPSGFVRLRQYEP